MKRLAAFGRFWWNFVVGDDWVAALASVIAIAATYLLAHDSVNAWWLMPPAVLLTLYVSLRRASPRRGA